MQKIDPLADVKEKGLINKFLSTEIYLSNLEY